MKELFVTHHQAYGPPVIMSAGTHGMLRSMWFSKCECGVRWPEGDAYGTMDAAIEWSYGHERETVFQLPPASASFALPVFRKATCAMLRRYADNWRVQHAVIGQVELMTLDERADLAAWVERALIDELEQAHSDPATIRNALGKLAALLTA